MTHKTIQDALEWRYATKKYDATKKISDADWTTLRNSLTLAPSSYGVQPWKFLVIENPDVRNQLKPVSWNQTQVTDASHYVVFLYKEKMNADFVQKFINRVAEVRSAPLEALDGYKNMLIENLVKAPEEKIRVWSQRQAYIAMGFLLQTAALLKIDATPMEGFDPAAYDKILGLEGSGWKTVATVALGYRHQEDALQNQKKVRFTEDDLIQYIK
ncbi:Putative NAD(P)H nitroreductase [Bdellovibrio bacteriovorus]|uniref:NAD(P)H-dependent oxidoreductase n=1 Tax=Bdellovibrio bacteriovorus TaxID=959 RepID=UPI00045BE793|nr:NAD(P)H-dependent oxidoreductase [Bdellovibrio bacteriovorus]AHZ86386.1 nitroreductase [Bdellovibrio bacteriovorus]BEV67627.1 Putative NAD(P)H nitroreductase [Bdellovibrio bacteriovorus]